MPAASATSAATLLLVRSVLHVLPHPGGGGETYVDTLERMGGFEFERLFLAPSPEPREALRTLCRTGVALQLLARKHDLVHVHGEVASGFALPSLALRPSVVTLNGLHLLRRLVGIPRLAAVANLRLVVAAATRTICVSNAERNWTLEVVGPRSGRRLLVDPEQRRPRPAANRRAARRGPSRPRASCRRSRRGVDREPRHAKGSAPGCPRGDRGRAARYSGSRCSSPGTARSGPRSSSWRRTATPCASWVSATTCAPCWRRRTYSSSPRIARGCPMRFSRPWPWGCLRWCLMSPERSRALATRVWLSPRLMWASSPTDLPNSLGTNRAGSS